MKSNFVFSFEETFHQRISAQSRMSPALLHLKLKGPEILIKIFISITIMNHLNFFKKHLNEMFGNQQYPKILEDKKLNNKYQFIIFIQKMYDPFDA